jgi:hypothetical protein
LSEADYSVNDNNPVLTVAVATEGSHSTDIALEIIPLTFSAYRALPPEQQTCERSLPSGDDVNEAESKLPLKNQPQASQVSL